jgi:hypothetical protein
MLQFQGGGWRVGNFIFPSHKDENVRKTKKWQAQLMTPSSSMGDYGIWRKNRAG